MKWHHYLLLFFISFTPLSARLTVELLPSVGVKNTTVYLGDIATIKSDGQESPEAVLQAKQLLIDNFSQIDSTKVVAAFKVKRLLEAEGVSNFNIVGLQSKIFVETRTITLKELEIAIDQWVKENIPPSYEVKLKYDRLPHNWKIPADDKVTIEVTSSNAHFAGKQTLTLKAILGAQVVSMTQATIELRIFQDAVVPLKKISKGTVIHRDDIAVKRVEVTKGAAFALSDLNKVAGMLAKKDFTPNEFIIKTAIEPPIILQKGAFCRLLIRNGDVEMNIPNAKALQNGRKGDLIAFENPVSPSSKLYGRILNGDMAVMDIG